MKTESGRYLKSLRNEFNLTQYEIAEFLCFKPQFVSLIENGHSKMPVELVPQLAKHPALKKYKKMIKKRFLYSLVSDYTAEIRKALK